MSKSTRRENAHILSTLPIIGRIGHGMITKPDVGTDAATIRLHPTERTRRFQSNLCMYCGQAGHFKSQCAEAIATRERNPGSGSSSYREAQVYREDLKDQSSA